MRFAFFVHPLSAQTKKLLQHSTGDELRRRWNGNVFEFCTFMHQQVSRRVQDIATGPRVIDELRALQSATGAQAEGRIYEIPLAPEEILADPVMAMEHLEQATQMAAEWGAKVVGLGAMTGIIGGQGTYLAERAPIAVTTGNSLTVYATLQNLLHICDEVDIDISRETVAVVGIPGSIASAVAKLLAPQCRELLLVARRSSSKADQLSKDLKAELLLDIPAALARSRVIVSATSTGNCIGQEMLRPGSIVVDVGVPTDVRSTGSPRADCLVISGGLARVPDAMPLDSMFLSFHCGMIPCCLGETMILGLEGRAESLSLGRNLDLDNIMQVGAAAREHGFDFSQFCSFGLRLQPAALAQFAKASFRRGRRPACDCASELTNGHAKNGKDRSRTNGKAAEKFKPADLSLLADKAATRYGRYVNPVLIALAGKNGGVQTFVKGDGNYLWDTEDRRYLDLVAGFGSLNLGHNHPRVTQALTSALAQKAPGFAQSSVNPLAAALAEQLVRISPPNLEMVFFANSGSEAVEAALKLARVSTGRPGLLYCERSYHGKTFGALSVTGNVKYQKPFAPLLPDCDAIRFGDLSALEAAISSRKFAAFIVEPIQAEGGMIVPPDGYLKEAQRLCRAAGTLLIVDEVQTGLGRTGDLFAVDREGIQPDAMTLAKSLGGGLMPIGAMLCRRDHWQQAYGTLQTFALHTSTFGGGSMACAAGLAALETLEDEHLVERAATRGRQLYDGLAEIAGRYEAVKEIRGRGLLLGMEFAPWPAQIIAHWKQTQGQGLIEFLSPQAAELIENMPSMYVMQNLMHEFGIYTQVARSNPLVLRIQPPLTITADEVDGVLTAMDTICHGLEESNELLGGLIGKTMMGENDVNENREARAQQLPVV